MTLRPLTFIYIVSAALLFFYLWSALCYMLLGFDYGAARPWSIFLLYEHFGLQRDYFEKIIIALCIVSACFLGLYVVWVSTGPKTYFGDARWATRAEIKAALLLRKDGLLLGKVYGRYICNDEPLHALVTAPTRSGKGVGIVIPNLLSWGGSALILDIKQENFNLTSGFRAKHQDVYLFSPDNEQGKSHRWNPLDTIRKDAAHRISDTQRLASILLPSPQNAEASMWIEEARDLFIGLTLYVLDVKSVPATIGEIYRTLKTEHSLDKVLEHILEQHKSALDPACIMAFNNFINKASKEQSGVRSSLSSSLNLWSIPSIDAATSASDFNIEDLRRRPASIYFATGLNQLKPLSRIIRLFFELSIDVLTRQLPTDDERHKVLMVIDEFGSLGKMPVIADNLAFIAGYNLRMLNIIQGLAQLDELYGKPARESMLQNSALQVFFAANDETTTQYVSRRVGDQTIQTESISFGQNTIMGTKSQSYTKTDFLKPEEFRRLCTKEAIIFKEGARPIKVQKLVYFKDKAFKARLYAALDIPKLAMQVIAPPVFDIAALEDNEAGNGCIQTRMMEALEF